MSAIPWSAEREALLRRKIHSAWGAFWLFAGGAVICIVLAVLDRWAWWLLLFAGFFVVALVALHDLARSRADLGEEMCRLPNGAFYEGSGMLANKPRSTANLTRWKQWGSSSGDWFVCTDCARPYRWGGDAQWIPNYPEPEDVAAPVDPGGGRYVILCRCGLGHYKLKA
jgi:hypothetical protein